MHILKAVSGGEHPLWVNQRAATQMVQSRLCRELVAGQEVEGRQPRPLTLQHGRAAHNTLPSSPPLPVNVVLRDVCITAGIQRF